MAEKNVTIVIKKKKGGGHAAAHGGAWKVAFADFMTAMMCFFLVMWLMGSDEEVKQAVTHYFNNPSSPWRIDVAHNQTIPLGDRTGSGETVVHGAEGTTPDELIEQPLQPYNTETGQTGGDDRGMTEEDANSKIPSADLNIELLKFSVPEENLFEPGSQELSTSAKAQLEKVGKYSRSHKGKIVVQSYTLPVPEGLSPGQDAYELSMARSVSVMKYLTSNRLVDEERISVKVGQNERKVASTPGRVIEFTFTQQ